MKTVTTLLISFLFTHISFGQEEEPYYYDPFATFSPAFFLGVPVNAFAEKLDKVAVGGSFDILYRFRHMPVSAGIQAGFSRYDTEKLKFTDIVDGEEVEFEWKTRSNIWLFHGVIRLEPPLNINIYPYLDGMIGTKRIYTRTILTDEFSDDEPIESYTDNSRWVFSFGAAVGLQIPLTKLGDIMLDFRCAYLQGNHAEYYVRKEDAGVIEDTIDAFELKSSPTMMLIPQIGVTLYISDDM